MSTKWIQTFRMGSQTFSALMDDALRCTCDQGDMPLCVRCECLFLLAVAATDFAYQVARQERMPRNGYPS